MPEQLIGGYHASVFWLSLFHARQRIDEVRNCEPQFSDNEIQVFKCIDLDQKRFRTISFDSSSHDVPLPTAHPVPSRDSVYFSEPDTIVRDQAATRKFFDGGPVGSEDGCCVSLADCLYRDAASVPCSRVRHLKTECEIDRTWRSRDRLLLLAHFDAPLSQHHFPLLRRGLYVRDWAFRWARLGRQRDFQLAQRKKPPVRPAANRFAATDQ